MGWVMTFFILHPCRQFCRPTKADERLNALVIGLIIPSASDQPHTHGTEGDST